MTVRDTIQLELLLETVTAAATSIEQQSVGEVNSQAFRILLQVEELETLLRKNGILPCCTE